MNAQTIAELIAGMLDPRDDVAEAVVMRDTEDAERVVVSVTTQGGAAYLVAIEPA